MFRHHYIKKGHTLEYLNNLSFADRLFMEASMLLEVEQEVQKWENLSGLFSP